MKKLFYFAILAILCACGSDKDSRSILFGSIAKDINEYQTKQKEIAFEGDTIGGKTRMAEIIKKSDKLNEKFLPKIQKSVEKINGQQLQIEVNPNQLKVVEPICMYFNKPLEVAYDGFWEDLKFILQANFYGKIETISDLPLSDGVKLPEGNKIQLVQPVVLAGYDSSNIEIYKSKIGYLPAEVNDSVTFIPRGSEILWLPLNYDNSLSEVYVRLDKLKIVIDN